MHRAARGPGRRWRRCGVANSLTLNSGTIQATDDSTDATLTHPSMAFAYHQVNTDLALISNMEQADGTALRISAGESVRLSFLITGITS